MKFAYFVFPHTGGTYSVFRNLRRGLSMFGVELCWLGVGEKARKAAASPEWANDREFGNAIGHEHDSELETARAIITALEEGGFTGVLVNVLGGRIETNVMRYLPKHILKVMVVHNITPATYAAARAIRDHVHTTVCVSPRIQADLVGNHDFDPLWTVTIPNGVDFVPAGDLDGRKHRQNLKAIFVGRIEDQAKGIFWLPDILRRLPEDVRLTVAGDGPDLPRLQKQSADLGARMKFLGAVPPEKIGKLLSEHDVFLMPSRFEGHPVALIEAMAAGCVPVASHIKGVTSTVVTHGTNGFLFPVGDTRQAATAIGELRENPARLSLMSQKARAKAQNAFGIQAMSEGYWEVLNRLVHAPPAIEEPLPLRSWSMASGLQPGLRRYIPLPVKNFLRMTKERLLA